MLNPHSKGDIFSEFNLIFFEIIIDNFIINVEINKVKGISFIIIVFINFKLYNWKLYILFIL